jgi:predicted kinase
MPLEVVVFVGLPGSGKSTFYRAQFSETHVHVSKDNFPNARDKQAHQLALVNEALAAGRSVVVDNTNPRVDDRRPLLDAARRRGARSVAYVFDVPIAKAIRRNESREGKARVPKVAIFTAAKRWQAPSYAEGFDEINAVTFDEQDAARVKKLPRPR